MLFETIERNVMFQHVDISIYNKIIDMINELVVSSKNILESCSDKCIAPIDIGDLVLKIQFDDFIQTSLYSKTSIIDDSVSDDELESSTDSGTSTESLEMYNVFLHVIKIFSRVLSKIDFNTCKCKFARLFICCTVLVSKFLYDVEKRTDLEWSIYTGYYTSLTSDYMHVYRLLDYRLM